MVENILTIDTDSRGAICLATFKNDKLSEVEFWRMPADKVNKKLVVNPVDLYDIIKYAVLERTPKHIVLERNWGRMGQAAGASFNFGKTNGTIISATSIALYESTREVEIDFVPAITWKGKMEVKGFPKIYTRDKAQEYIDKHKVHVPKKLTITQGDALMMALYAKEYLS